MSNLRPFQQSIKSAIFDHWRAGVRNVLVKSPTGSGKTVITSSVIRDLPQTAVASIAHRSELVTQKSLALAREGIHHRVIGPDSLRRNCVTLQMEELGRSYYNAGARVGVCSVDTLRGRKAAGDPWFLQVGLWDMDECFPAGTLVDGRPIETLQVGQYVRAFDEASGMVVPRRIAQVFKNPEPKNMVRILTHAHHVLCCTESHPIYTRRGWVLAKNLTNLDEVLTHELHAMRRGNTDDQRGGREQPRDGGAEGARCEERGVLVWARVESVALHKRRDFESSGSSRGDGFVYNIEVEEFHTYLANGIVVHNCHHVLRANKWGEAAAMFPNAYGLGVTATPARADGKGLGKHADGLFEALVEGPTLRDLIDTGYLTDYRIFAPPSDVDYSEVTVTASGDYSPVKLRAAVHASDKIVGDVVSHYLKLARGKLGITFAVDVEAAQQIAAAFNAAGVPAEVVTAKTPDLLRAQVLRRFKARQVLQLVNVDLFGEGFDLPAVEVVSMVRKTESWPLYVQQFGRALRLMISPDLSARWGSLADEERRAHIAASDKPVALIIDHVGNVIRHGLPDAPRFESLDRRERRSAKSDDAMPVRVCANPQPCASVYPRFLKACPFCGFVPEPAARSAPEFVDGDLYELDAATLAAMRGRVAQIDGAPRIPGHLDAIAARGLHNRHYERQVAQHALRERIALWAGWQSHLGRSDAEAMRVFYLTYGIDILGAQALGRPDAEALGARIQTQLDRNGVVST